MNIVVLTKFTVLYYRFADMCVRAKAVEWLAELSDDDICDILPQLVQVQLIKP